MTNVYDEPKLLAALTFLVVGITTEQDKMESLRIHRDARAQDAESFEDYSRDIERCGARATKAIAKVGEVLGALGIPTEDRIRVGTALTDYGVALATKVLADGYAPIWREVVKDA